MSKFLKTKTSSEKSPSGSKKNKKKIRKCKSKQKKSKSSSSYSTENIVQAMQAVKEGSTIREAADKFAIPKSTLFAKLKNLSPLDCRKGPPPLLSKEREGAIVSWIMECHFRGFPVTKSKILDGVQKYINESKIDTIFKDGRPGKSWFQAFQNRHPQLSKRIAQNLSSTRAKVSEIELRKWFVKIEEYLQNKNLLDIEPNRVFNLDESAFQIVPKSEKVLAPKGARNVYQIVSANERGTVTVLFNASADGTVAPPLILFELKKSPKRTTLQHIPEGWGVGQTESGWMTGESFFSYTKNIFHPWLLKKKVQLPIIVFVDNHKSHVNEELLMFCQEKQLEMIALYPNSTHILQPLDTAFFHPLKNMHKEEFIKYKTEHDIVDFKKYMVAPVLQKVLEKGNFEQAIKNGFKSSGLYPFDAEAIDYNILNKKKKNRESKKSTGSSASTETNLQLNTEKNLDFLHLFESSIISQSTLEEFLQSENQEIWLGDQTKKALFESWKKLKQLTSI